MPSKQLHVSRKCSKVSALFPQRIHIGLSWDLLNEALIGDPYEFLDTMLSKHQWKNLIKSKIHSYWISTISEVCNLYSSLKYLKGSYKIGQCHPLATTISANMRDIIRIPIRLKIATILQAIHPNNMMALLWASASAGNNPDIMYIA
jgi:hypothetical protein